MAKQIEKLTANKVRRACRPGRLGDGGGLYLQITPSGNKSWIFRYGRQGREHFMGLGPLHTVSLVEARHAAQQARKYLFQNIDPLARKRQHRRRASIRPEHKRFKACAEEYIREHAAGWRNDKHRQQWENTMRDYVYPYLGAIDVRRVDTAEILHVLRPIWTAKTETATRVRERIQRVLDWATVHQYREGRNPARWKGHLEVLLPPPAKLKRVRHHAALPFQEIGEFMAALREQRGVAAHALEFAILTACRSGEILKATWMEIDLERGTWTLPAERTKAGRAHRVPLSTAALKVLAAQTGRSGKYVFPGGTEDGTLSSVAMTQVLKRAGVGGVTVHGFRSTFRDWVAEQTRYPSEWAEISLEHRVGSATEMAYFRSDLLEERRGLMEDWARWCAGDRPPSQDQGLPLMNGPTGNPPPNRSTPESTSVRDGDSMALDEPT
ncbi:tyrosine-type recombinase/integrase [Diaphorobacter nitroreducens]|uniref:tyrosine-type recombinase/integrase n=1 Tax=Diaphorobacter nitroreducens TaxID=164759 RepID=UPI0028A0404F|nr:integrase arm-type DNA-binding domain-containing protein [Diaphorobacter nitroreducens]